MKILIKAQRSRIWKHSKKELLVHQRLCNTKRKSGDVLVGMLFFRLFF